MILAVFSCLFIFLGMYIGEKYDLKKLSINVIFGLFVVNTFQCISAGAYPFMFVNYHNTTYFYIVLGYLLLKLINCKYDDCDNISVLGFTIINTCLFIAHSFNILFLVINILYYIMIGIYIKKSKSWIYILLGCGIALILSLFKIWFIGYIYTINAGFILYFVFSVYNIVFRSKDKSSLVSLILGLVIALIGGLL